MTGADLLQPYANFFYGQDPSRWRTQVPTYGEVHYRDLYPGVDVVVRKSGGGIEYDLLLHPGASLDQVRVRFTGARSLTLDAEGMLRIETAVGSLRHSPPRSFELHEDGRRSEILCELVELGENVFGYRTPRRSPGAAS